MGFLTRAMREKSEGKWTRTRKEACGSEKISYL